MDDQGANREGGRKRFRKLRIAWSAICAIACVLWIALWIRSFSLYDRLHWQVSPNRVLSASSVKGKWTASTYEYQSQPTLVLRHRHANDRAVILEELVPEKMTYKVGVVLHVIDMGSGTKIIAPHAVVAALLTAAGVAPWLRLRFSLRTLLIAMTLVAVGLGLVVYALRN